MGGQTALNLARELAESGMLDELGVELIGAKLDVINRAEDRQLFKDAVESCKLRVPTSIIVTDIAQIEGVATPAVVRPAFTLGGHGGGFANTTDELRAQVEIGFAKVRSDRCWSRSQCAAGTSSSSKSFATASTTS